MIETDNAWRQYDIYQRYTLLRRILDVVFADGAGRVLDVGSGTGDLSGAFLPGLEIVLCDTETGGRPDIVGLQPGRPLPFEDASFEVVVAMDVLEHVPRDQRQGLLSELARVANRCVVLSYPHDSTAVIDAERLLAGGYRSWFGGDNRFLGEHAELGLPGREFAADALRQHGYATITIGSAALQHWLPFSILDVALLAVCGEDGAKDRFNRRINELATDVAVDGESYRVFTIAGRSAAMLDRIADREAARMQPLTPRTELALQEVVAEALNELARARTDSQLTSGLAAKDEHIRKMEALMAARDEDWRQIVAAKDAHIGKLEQLVQEHAREVHRLTQSEQQGGA